jgi:hypothetical protein
MRRTLVKYIREPRLFKGLYCYRRGDVIAQHLIHIRHDQLPGMGSQNLLCYCHCYMLMPPCCLWLILGQGYLPG